MVRFVWFGRLCQEKGAHVLRDSIFSLADNFSDAFANMEFVVFGDGEYADDFNMLGEQYENIDYRGWQGFDEISHFLKQSDYCLFPSLFLETFGLTALESLSHGIPVLTYRKGAQQMFLLEGCAVDDREGDTLADQLSCCLLDITNNYDINKWNQLSLEAKKKADAFGVDQWYKRFREIYDGKPQRVMLVSDYSTKLGGIESYLYKVSSVLESHDIVVDIVGMPLGRGRIWKVLKYVLFALSLFNLPFWLFLQFRIRRDKPDLVFYHSALRSIGWLGFCVKTKQNCQKWMMYHDLGYVHPFPHAVVHKKQLLSDLSFHSFWIAAAGCSFFHRFFLLGKWILLVCLQQVLGRKVNKHLVPSSFMIAPLKSIYGMTDILVLPHFLEK